MNNDNPHSDSSVRYRLLAQYRDNTIRVEDIVAKKNFITTAQKIICDPTIISSFTSRDASIIGYIAGSIAATETQL